MKVQELLESQTNNAAAHKKIEDLMSDLASFIEDRLTSHEVEFGVAQPRKDGVSLKDESGEIGHLEIHGSFKMVKYVEGRNLVPTAEGSLVIDTPLDNKIHERLKRIISRFFESQNLHLTWSRMTPWVHKNHQTDTATFTLARFEKILGGATPSTAAGKSPRDAFMSSPGEAARQKRIAATSHGDSFGGDASNYSR